MSLKKKFDYFLNITPVGLIYTRLIFGFVIFTLAFVQIDSSRLYIVLLIIAGMLTDIFDGIIARKLNISSIRLRRLDSTIDQIFWIFTSISAYIICPDFFKANYIRLLILLAFEGLTYIVSFVKFKKEVATHAFLSKIWAITIMATLIQIFISCKSFMLFNICIYFGIVTRIEIISILLIIKEWSNDIPSLYHAIILRQGKTIKRNKLFNG